MGCAIDHPNPHAFCERQEFGRDQASGRPSIIAHSQGGRIDLGARS